MLALADHVTSACGKGDFVCLVECCTATTMHHALGRVARTLEKKPLTPSSTMSNTTSKDGWP